MASRRRPMSEINVVPYIDVMLVLLVIFMVTAPLLTQGVLVELPKEPSDPLERADESPLIVTIKPDGSLFMNVGTGNFDEEGDQVTSSEMQERAEKIFNVRADAPVFVRADTKLDYGVVINAMTILQKAGAPNVGLITEPPES